MRKIGFVVALSGELEQFINQYSDRKSYKIASFNINYVVVSGKELYFIQSGVGEIAAAAATQLLITAFGVEVVINFGVCGKISSDLKILDVVAVEKVVPYQFDLSGIDNTKVGEYYADGNAFIKTDEHLLDRFIGLKNVKKVTCASGDKFIANEEDKKYLSSQFGADICEMECAAILITCKANNLPCLIVKSVSDDCDSMDFSTYMSLAAKSYVEMITMLICEL